MAINILIIIGLKIRDGLTLSQLMTNQLDLQCIYHNRPMDSIDQLEDEMAIIEQAFQKQDSEQEYEILETISDDIVGTKFGEF